MKRFVILIVSILMVTLTSCSNDIEVNEPSFNVATEKQYYKKGDTVKFIFSGYADYITFYSGEKGAQHEYRLRDKIDGATPKLTFTSTGKYGTQLNSLRLFVLSNLNSYTKEGIYASQMDEITNRAALSTGTEVNSGVIDLTDFVDKGLLSIAFKYTGTKDPVIPQKSWWIKDLSLNTLDSKGNIYPIIPTLNEGGWTQVNIEGTNRKWTVSDNQLYIGANANEDSNEDWIITKSINLAEIKPDKGTPIKSMTGPVDSWWYVYDSPGEYKATFAVTNGNVYGQKNAIKEVTIIVEN